MEVSSTAPPKKKQRLRVRLFFYGRFYKLALTDCATIFEVNFLVSERV